MKIARLVVASATAVSLTFAGAGIAQAQTTTAQPAAEQTASSGAGTLSSQSGAATTTTATPKPTDPATEQSSQLVASQAGPFAPLLLKILPVLSALLNMIDQLFEGLSFVPGLLNGK
ncbi:hypothetical protein [Corynebacterium lubricantis]|uniref:hypothetical protein n=1 Tax=Corynebacterium lubricantis TaxID=541095 RepID=UPI00037351D6|nr:hypothetical protein [Corynebacterium lubricantis]